MADVGFHRTDCAVFGGTVRGLECARERLDFDRISQRGGRAMRFDHRDRIGGDLGDGQSFDHRGGLTFGGRAPIADLGAPIVVDSRSSDNCVDDVPIGDRGGETFEHDDADAAAKHGSGGVRIERAAVTVVRRESQLAPQVAFHLWDPQRYAAG